MKYINLIGLDDIRFSKLVREKDRGKSAIKETLQQLKDDSTFNLLLSHRPELFDTYASSKVDLVFCGHAHGGQIRIKGQGGFAPGQGFIPKYTAGVHTKETTTMVVSRGIGNSLAPFRINNNPEIISVTLKCKEKSQ